ncbi:5874_t:CDS:2, partial [Paraglomus occultum]
MEQTEMSDSDQSPPSPLPKDLRKVPSPIRIDVPNRPRPVSSYNSPIVSRISNTPSSTRSGSPVSSGKDRTKNETPTKKDRRISNSRKNTNGVKSVKEPEGTIVIVGIDFGTTASGFAYADAINPNVIEIFDDWPCWQGYLKTSTSILYDSITGTAVQWGEETQVSLIRKRRRLMNSMDSNFKELEAFKMIIVKYGEEDAVELWKKAVVDYLTNFGAKLQQALQAVYPSISLSKNASIILSIPSFFSASVQSLLCECFERALSIPSSNLHFVYESVASAVYCMRLLPGHHEDVGCKFLVVTCGGETVQLTVRQLMENDKLRECTIQTGEICGAMEVEKEFEAWFGKRVGIDGLTKWKKEYYGQWKYLLHVFIKEVKYEFTGIEENFRPFRLDLLEFCPNLKYLVSESYRAQLKSVEWIIDVTFADVKSFFDPIVDKIIKLISDQIKQCENVDVMFIVGGFANSEYLVRRIKKEFKDTVKKITVPAQPIAAVLKGSVFY